MTSCVVGFLPVLLTVPSEPYVWLVFSTCKSWDVLEFCAVYVPLSFWCSPYLLDQGSENFFLKGQLVNILDLVGCMVPVTNTQLCQYSQKVAINKWCDSVPMLTLRFESPVLISYNSRLLYLTLPNISTLISLGISNA